MESQHWSDGQRARLSSGSDRPEARRSDPLFVSQDTGGCRPCTLPNVYVSGHPLIQHKLSILRNQQTEPKKFRELIREISILLAYEATADLGLTPCSVETPMATAPCSELTETIGLVPILRAGLGMVEGIWDMMPGAEVWHIGLVPR